MAHATSEARDGSTVCPVLVADNDRIVSGLLVDVLARGGVSVAQAFDGLAARAMARASGLRVLVCDLDMPGASGLEVIESLADLDQPPAVVVVSGYVDDDVRAILGRWSYVRTILHKPFDLLQFAEVVRRLVDAAPSAPAASAEGAT